MIRTSCHTHSVQVIAMFCNRKVLCLAALATQTRSAPCVGHEATDTGLAYAPVSQAHGHHHTQFNVLPCCTAAQTRSDHRVCVWGGWHKALVVGSVSLWRRLLASRL